MHSSPLPTPFLTGQTSTYRWLPMESDSLRMQAFNIPYALQRHLTFRPDRHRSSVSLSASPTPATIFLHLTPIISRWPLKNTMAHSLTHSHIQYGQLNHRPLISSTLIRPIFRTQSSDTLSLLGCSALAHLTHPFARILYLLMPTADSF